MSTHLRPPVLIVRDVFLAEAEHLADQYEKGELSNATSTLDVATILLEIASRLTSNASQAEDPPGWHIRLRSEDASGNLQFLHVRSDSQGVLRYQVTDGRETPWSISQLGGNPTDWLPATINDYHDAANLAEELREMLDVRTPGTQVVFAIGEKS